MGNTKSGYFVAIEWDGFHAPSKWYSRLARFGLSASGTGNKEIGPMERRAAWKGSTDGVVLQEGMIFCTSETTARILGNLATQLGARSVSVGELVIKDAFMTPEDEAILDRVSTILSKRGKPAPETDWVVTCASEAKSWPAYNRQPVCCPACGSFEITARPGEKFRLKTAGTTFEDWKSSRFHAGTFEIPLTADPDDEEAVEASGVPTDFEDIRRIKYVEENFHVARSRYSQFRLWDLAYCAAGLSRDVRQTNRIKAAGDFIAQGKDIQVASLIVGDELDLLDLYCFDKKFVMTLAKEE